ncbi:MAG: leucine-rich repeat protein [Clostridia bacterium]|nr:leucine-rich repeat protein [Clostridia bacterium]
MKRKLLLTFVMVIAFALTFALVVFADTIHNENTVDYSETVTLNDGTVLPLYDENKEALIWYISGTDSETGKNIYTSIRSDDLQVRWYTKSWGEVTGVDITYDNGTKISKNDFVVVNMMDDDIVSNYAEGGHTNIGKPIKSFKWLFEGCKKLEFVYLRLDTDGIFQRSFNGCSNLRYINLEDLNEWTNCRDGQQFCGCTSLFAGQVLDLTHTKLVTLSGGGTLSGMPIIGLKLPSTLKSLNDWVFQGTMSTTFMYPENLSAMPTNAFKNCSNLATVYLHSTLTTIGDNAFLSCNALDKICFVGTKDQLEALVTNTSATGNTAFTDVVGENGANIISYADYLALEDKSGKYAIYDYSYCDAYKESVHAPNEKSDDCTKILCDDCTFVLKGLEAHSIVDKVVYENGFAKDGVYHYYCTNERCTVIDKEGETKAPIFSASGYSTNAEGNAITGGYTVDFSALDFFKSKNGNLRYGIIIANANSFDGEVLDGDFKVTSQKAIQVEIDSNYANFNCSINYGANTGANLELVITAYAIDAEGNVTFIQADSVYAENATIGSNILKKITLAKVVANQPAKSDDE